jgi:iron complex transport system substrate-binding protein
MFKEQLLIRVMTITRIVSFLPSATELIYELACQLLNEGKDIFILNEAILKKANPDLIITQETCEVCAAYTNQVNKAIQILAKKPTVYSMDPHSLEEILTSVTEIGEILGKNKRSKEIRIKLGEKISYIKKLSNSRKTKVLAIEWIDPFFTAGHWVPEMIESAEWIDPFFTAGHWVPEMIESAGGINMISKKGEHSRKMTFYEISKSDPEIIILMPCGFDTERTVEEYNKILKNNSDWSKLKAVKNKKIFAVDANSYLKIIQPENFVNLSVPRNSFFNVIEPILA